MGYQNYTNSNGVSSARGRAAARGGGTPPYLPHVLHHTQEREKTHRERTEKQVTRIESLQSRQ